MTEVGECLQEAYSLCRNPHSLFSVQHRTTDDGATGVFSVHVVRGAGGVCLVSFLCVFYSFQVNLCEAAAISRFICRQAWQQGGREGGSWRKEGGGEKEGEQ